MRTRLITVVAVGILQAHAINLPQSYPISRYEPLWKHNPFTVSSVSEQSNAGFAQQLVLTGYGKIGSKEYITVFNRQTQERQFLSTTPNAQDMKLVSVQVNPVALKTTATIQKGSETSVLQFDPTISAPAASAQPNAVPAPMVNNPGNPVAPIGPQAPLRSFRRNRPIPAIPNPQP